MGQLLVIKNSPGTHAQMEMLIIRYYTQLLTALYLDPLAAEILAGPAAWCRYRGWTNIDWGTWQAADKSAHPFQYAGTSVYLRTILTIGQYPSFQHPICNQHYLTKFSLFQNHPGPS
jgi:hypothetical protein